jgi:hypothetical protein
MIEQYCPSNQTTAPSKTQINQHEERPNKNFSPKPSMILAFKKNTEISAQTALILPSYGRG